MKTRGHTQNLEGQEASLRNQNDARPAKPIRLTLRSLRLYRAADALSGGLIYFMVIFSPWAFGTTQSWSVWVMNIFGYSLGFLVLIKLYVRFRQGYRPSRWGEQSVKSESVGWKFVSGKILVVALATLTVIIVGYCLISALNVRATYQADQYSFEYHDYIKWLPHSYDGYSTWRAFWNYLALAFAFWAVRDWLFGKSVGEAGAHRSHAEVPDHVSLLPRRLGRLLWLLSINGALLGVEGICQRISDTNKLLWLVPTRVNQAAELQFGPYAYRANAAQYFNLVWPATLGLWWVLRREAQRRLKTPATLSRTYHHLLLPCVLVMAACPIISASRGGAIVAAAMLVVAAFILVFALRRRHPSRRFAVVLFFAAVFAFGAYLGGDELVKRMRNFDTGLADREQIYKTARGMARDYPLFGIGPGAFDPLFQLYRTSPEEYWPAQLHNDWLETRITFGWVGCSLIEMAFLVVLLRWFTPGGIPGEWQFVMLLWLALAGCLVHARFDFPFQNYSILSLFVMLCAVLFVLSRHGQR